MSTAPVTDRYTVDDLDLARLRCETPHVELDPWGNLIVTPASDPHEYAIYGLREQIEDGLEHAGIEAAVYPNGPAWKVPGGSGYLNQPDLTVLLAGTTRSGPDGLSFSPPPLLVVEVASPSTRAIDRSRKRADYLLGGAQAYWMLDLPALTRANEPALTVVTRTAGGEDEHGPLNGRPQLTVPFPVTLDLAATVFADRWA